MKEFDWEKFWRGALGSLEMKLTEKEHEKVSKIISEWVFEYHSSNAEMNCFKCEFVDTDKYPGEYWCTVLSGVTLTPERECSCYDQAKKTSPEDVGSAYHKENARLIRESPLQRLFGPSRIPKDILRGSASTARNESE